MENNMRKLYENKPILFAVLWIVLYCVVMAPIRGRFGDDSVQMLLGLVVISMGLLLFINASKLQGELVGILAQGLGCSAAEAEKVFLTFFAVAHGLASLLCHNAMEYDETECAGMLETVFFGALAALEEERNGKQHA